MDDSAEILVLRDQAGQYYLLPRTALDAARVPAEQAPALERALAGDDTGGFLYGPLGLPQPSGGTQPGGEIDMISIQSLVSQRATAIQLTTSLITALNNSMQSITRNIR